SLPTNRLVALARIGWYQLRLARHPLTWSRRAARDVDPRAASRIDVCWSVGAGLGMVDSMRSMIFVYLGALLALEAGDEARVARAQSAAAVADGGVRPRARAARRGGVPRRGVGGDLWARARLRGPLLALAPLLPLHQ